MFNKTLRLDRVNPILAACLLGASVDSWANVVVENMTAPIGWAGNNIYVGNSWSHAVSVTTGNSSYTVDHVQFRLMSGPPKTTLPELRSAFIRITPAFPDPK